MFKKILIFFIFFLNKSIISNNLINFLKNHDFNNYMIHSVYFRNEFTVNDNEWKILKSQFDNLSKLKLSNEEIIPQKIHQIWLGSPFPEKYKKLQQSWIKKHPNWEYKLWTEKEIEQLGLKNIELYNMTKNYGEKSDIARYEILYRFGGVYVDCDFECLKSLDDFIYCCDFFAGLGYGPDAVVLSGIIGSSKGHQILKSCIDEIKRNESSEENFMEILNRTSIFHLTKCFFKKYTERSVIFPITFFYPLPDINRNDKNVYKFIRPESYAIHYWHLSWNNGQTY